MALFSVTRVVAESQSMGASFTTAEINATEARSVFLQVKVSGAAALDGTLSIEATNDPLDTASWQQLGTLSVVVTNDGTRSFDIPVSGVPYLRVKWVRTTGTANARITYSIRLER